jgi:hypothetical protein
MKRKNLMRVFLLAYFTSSLLKYRSPSRKDIIRNQTEWTMRKRREACTLSMV